MDVRNICLGIITRGDTTGYKIKELFGHRRDQCNTEATVVATA